MSNEEKNIMNKEEKLDLLDETIHWLKILFLEDVEKDIMDKRSAIEIEHYYESVIFSAIHTKEIVDKLKNVREEIIKNIREEKKKQLGVKWNDMQ